MPEDLAVESPTTPDPAVVEAAAESAVESAASQPPTHPEFCPACDHGVVAGKVCETCKGSGYAPKPLAEETNPKRAPWTPEKRAALSEKMKAKHQSVAPAAPSPFALSDEHEFPTGPSQVDRVDIYSNPPGGEPTLIDSIPLPPPALPGTPSSPFRRCPCLGVLPGRVCTFCYSTKWTKLCPKCLGEGRIQINLRKGAERSQPCGHCGGKGTLPANMREIGEATRLVEEFAATPAGQSLVIADPETSAAGFRRATRLPGIGVTATKRGGTLIARKRDRLRNETRKAKRSASKVAVEK